MSLDLIMLLTELPSANEQYIVIRAELRSAVCPTFYFLSSTVCSVTVGKGGSPTAGFGSDYILL